MNTGGVDFTERAPSSGWEPLTLRGEHVADAWFRPGGDPLAVAFRVPEERLVADDIERQVTVEDLLAAAGVPNAAAESWQFRGETHAGEGGTNLELKRLLPPPPPGKPHLTVRVRLAPPAAAGGEPADVPPEEWQALDAVWKAVLALEGSIEGLRLGMDGLRLEMEAAFRKPLSTDEKLHALQADVAQWGKSKSRVHFALPKVKEFVHRATWAAAAAERKRLQEVVEAHLLPRVPHPRMGEVREQLEHMQKARQVLLAAGNAVNQECRGIVAEVQRALGTLQRNAADRARQKRSAGREKGKHF